MEKDLMNNECENFGELQFTLKEIAIIVGHELSSDDLTSVQRGRLKAIAEVRRSILTQAKQGSAPAQKEFIKLSKFL